MALFKPRGQSVLLANMVLVGLTSTAILTTAMAVQSEEPPKKLAAPFDEIANTYRNNYAAIKSLKLVTRPSVETLIDPKVYYKAYKNILIKPEDERETLVLDGDKVLLNHWQKGKTFNGVTSRIRQQHPGLYASSEPLSMVTYEEFMKQLPNTPVESRESIRIFDGQVLLNNNRGNLMSFGLYDVDSTLRPVLMVQYPSHVKIQEFFIDGGFNYLDMMLYGITGAKVDYDYRHRAKFRMPDLLANEKWRVVADHERLDGADCLVIESTDKNKLWLDPKAGFAVRRWTTGNPITTDREYHDLRHVAGHFWMPQAITLTWFGDNLLPNEYRGKPVMRYRYEMTSFELNEPVPEESFRLAPSPGTIVYDVTLKPLDARGNPMDGVSNYEREYYFGKYIHPADPADLPKVVKAAAIELGSQLSKAIEMGFLTSTGEPKRASTGQPVGSANASPILPALANRVSWFVVVNASLLLIGVGYLAYRRRFS